MAAAPALHYPQAPSTANGGGAQVGQEGLGQDPEEALLIGTKLLKAAFVEKDESFRLFPHPGPGSNQGPCTTSSWSTLVPRPAVLLTSCHVGLSVS